MRKGRSPDPRAARTRDKLAAAFTGLAARNSGVPLSVSDITQAAGLNRSSFYAHFDDTADLALYVLEKALAEISVGSARDRAAGAVSGRAATAAALERLLDQVEHQRAELVAVFGSTAGGAARFRFGERLRIDLREYLERLDTEPPRSAGELDTAAEFVGHGLAAAVVGWLTGAIDASRRDLVPMLVDLVPRWVTDGRPRP